MIDNKSNITYNNKYEKFVITNEKDVKLMVVIRKNDSATSLLLFIYNNYSAHYNKNTLKLSSLLEIMRAFGKSETATRMALSRAVKAGILINDTVGREVYYKLAPIGKDAIDVWNNGISEFWKRYSLRNQPWDGKWHLLNLEFTDENKDSRIAVLEELKHLGFGVLTTNTWLTPYSQEEEVNQVLSEYNINKGIVEINGEMAIRNDINSFLISMFQLKNLEKEYENFNYTFHEKLKELKKIYHEDWFIDGGFALPLLHSIGWEFFHIATRDVMLPRALYPVWIGDEAANLMIECRRILLDATIKYLGKFD